MTILMVDVKSREDGGKKATFSVPAETPKKTGSQLSVSRGVLPTQTPRLPPPLPPND